MSKEEYDEFYKTTFKAYDTPDAYTHFSLEGQVRRAPVGIGRAPVYLVCPVYLACPRSLPPTRTAGSDLRWSSWLGLGLV